MAEAAVSLLLEHLSRLLNSDLDLISAAEISELRLLKNDLGVLKSLLGEAAANVKKDDKRWREMERQIMQVVYDVEDAVDSCLILAARGNKPSRRRTKPAVSINVSLEEEVRSLREDKVKPMLDKARMDFPNMQIGGGSDSTRVERQWAEEKIMDKILHLTYDQEEKICGYLMEAKEELDVISLTGMPGVGKTALAWNIYQSKAIRHEFPNCIWVQVSQAFNRKDVFLEILKQFTSQDMSSLKDQELAQIVYEHLEKEPFLLVVDDVWSIDAWDAIRAALPTSNGMAKVLITSRSTNVARHANHAREPHNLRLLTEREGWELLQYKVFGGLDSCPEELRDVGEYIADKCDGLPLATTVIGEILAGKISGREARSAIINEWNMVAENMDVMFNNERRILDSVALSYNRFSDDLRDCFLYLGVFPENYVIPARILTYLWIAEGFIRDKAGQSLEEIAEENLKELIDENLVMICRTNFVGGVKSFVVHKVIHAFCTNLIREQNLFQETKMINKEVFDPPVCWERVSK